MTDTGSAIDCSTAVRTRPSSVAISVCQREYARTRAPGAGIQLAELLRQSGERAAAKTIAHSLVLGAARGDAWQLLGQIAAADRQLDAAALMLALARAHHRAEGAGPDVARDDRALGQLHYRRARYGEALLAFDDCLAGSRAAGDAMMEFYCHLGAGVTLSRVGALELASLELERAKAVMSRITDFPDRELASLELERGNLAQELDRMPLHANHDEEAIEAFQHVLALDARVHAPGRALAAELNLAYSLGEARRFAEADAHLARARALDVKRDRAVDLALVEAHVALRRGALAQARAGYAQAYPDLEDDDDRIEAAAALARIALATGELAVAERWATAGVAAVERIRDAQGPLELRPWVLSARRAPYELGFTALARAGRVEDALVALDAWQGRSLLDALASPAPRVAGGLRGEAARVQALGSWLPVATRAPFAQPTGRTRAVDALRTTDVLALIIAEGHLWRLAAIRGALTARDLGPARALKPELDAFLAAPTDAALGAALGDLLLPEGAARATTRALHVLVDGPLAGLPVAALRHAGLPVIAARPVVRIARLPEAACGASARPRHATVLADAAGDLHDARGEAADVARATALDATTSLGAAATSQALFAAARDDLLHVAVHARLDDAGSALQLADRDVPALEIAARGLRAALVVLSACVSARASDAELAGALATGFLAAGTPIVIATLRPVSDPGAAALTSRFYRAGGAADPIRALARVQAELAATDDTDWPNFAVFGGDRCVTPGAERAVTAGHP